MLWNVLQCPGQLLLVFRPHQKFMLQTLAFDLSSTNSLIGNCICSLALLLLLEASLFCPASLPKMLLPDQVTQFTQRQFFKMSASMKMQKNHPGVNYIHVNAKKSPWCELNPHKWKKFTLVCITSHLDGKVDVQLEVQP